MAKAVYIGVDGASRKITSVYIGIDDVARKIKKGYIGDENGLARLFFGEDFPETPTEYSLINKYTESTIFTAPEDGWYKFEVFGASGNGGKGYGNYDTYEDSYGDTVYRYVAASGGSGGNGGYSSSVVKLKQGDTVDLTVGAVGTDTSVTANSTVGESYDIIQVTSGGNGGNASGNGNRGKSTMAYAGTGGTGGVATGGNLENVNGKDGNTGQSLAKENGSSWTEYATAKTYSPTPDNPECTTGGYGGHGSGYDKAGYAGGSGSAGFVKVYRGNTNVVA